MTSPRTRSPIGQSGVCKYVVNGNQVNQYVFIDTYLSPDPKSGMTPTTNEACTIANTDKYTVQYASSTLPIGQVNGSHSNFGVGSPSAVLPVVVDYDTLQFCCNRPSDYHSVSSTKNTATRTIPLNEALSGQEASY